MRYTITLEYHGKEYTFLDTFNYEGWDADRDADYQVTYMYEEGNYACDCNRSTFIADNCDEDFPELECGHEITLVSIKKAEHVVWPEVRQEEWKPAPSGIWLPA